MLNLLLKFIWLTFFIDLIFFEDKFGICKFSFDFIFIFILYEGFLFSRFLKKIKRRDMILKSYFLVYVLVKFLN